MYIDAPDCLGGAQKTSREPPFWWEPLTRLAKLLPERLLRPYIRDELLVMSAPGNLGPLEEFRARLPLWASQPPKAP